MNLFFRLILVFIRARFSSKRIDILGQTSLNYRVWYTDQDLFMHLTNSRYLSFADLGTINWIMRTGYWKQLRKRGWYPVINTQIVSVGRMLKAPQAFEVKTRITGWTDTYVGLEHQFVRNGRVHAEVSVVAQFASFDKTRVTPQDVLATQGVETPSPDLPQIYLDLIEEVEQARRRYKGEK